MGERQRGTVRRRRDARKIGARDRRGARDGARDARRRRATRWTGRARATRARDARARDDGAARGARATVATVAEARATRAARWRRARGAGAREARPRGDGLFSMARADDRRETDAPRRDATVRAGEVVQRDEGIRVHRAARWKRRDIRASIGDRVRGIPVGVGGARGGRQTKRRQPRLRGRFAFSKWKYER